MRFLGSWLMWRRFMGVNMGTKRTRMVSDARLVLLFYRDTDTRNRRS